MRTLLMIALVVAVMVLALTPVIARIVARLVVRIVARRVLEAVGERALARQPDAVSTTPAPNHTWRDAAAVDHISSGLARLGFSEVGVYAVDQFPGVFARFFVKPEDAVCSCVYEHPKVGVWF